MATLRNVLKGIDLFTGTDDFLGQIEEITLPTPEIKVEEHRNSGMAMAVEVPMGWEKLEFEFKMPTVDPAMLRLFGLQPGVERSWILAGSLQDDDGATHSAKCLCEGFMKKIDLGAWKQAEKSDSGFMVSVRSFTLLVDGVELVHMSPFEVRVGGVSQTASLRAALLR